MKLTEHKCTTMFFAVHLANPLYLHLVRCHWKSKMLTMLLMQFTAPIQNHDANKRKHIINHFQNWKWERMKWITSILISPGFPSLTPESRTPLHPVTSVLLNNRLPSIIPLQPGVEMQYPGRLFLVYTLQTLKLHHELWHHHLPLPFLHHRYFRIILPVSPTRGPHNSKMRPQCQATRKHHHLDPFLPPQFRTR